jgi:hypothetical protein
LSRELAPICAKSFINRFYLILLNSKILFDVMGREETNTPSAPAFFYFASHQKGERHTRRGPKGLQLRPVDRPGRSSLVYEVY